MVVSRTLQNNSNLQDGLGERCKLPFSPPSSQAAQQQRRVGGKAEVNQPMNKVQHSQIHTTAGLVFLPTPTNTNREHLQPVGRVLPWMVASRILHNNNGAPARCGYAGWVG